MGVSADLPAHKGELDRGVPMAEGFHFSSEAPQTGDPQSLPEPQGHREVGQGAPLQSPEQLSCTQLLRDLWMFMAPFLS